MPPRSESQVTIETRLQPGRARQTAARLGVGACLLVCYSCAAAVELGAMRGAVAVSGELAAARAAAVAGEIAAGRAAALAGAEIAEARFTASAAGISVPRLPGSPMLRGGRLIEQLARTPQIPTGSARVFSRAGKPLVTIESGNGRVVIRGATGNPLAVGRRLGNRVEFRDPLGNFAGESRINGTELRHYVGPGRRFVGYDEVVGDSILHRSPEGLVLGETLISTAGLNVGGDILALLAIAAAGGSCDDKEPKGGSNCAAGASSRYRPLAYSDSASQKTERSYRPVRE